ncbi:MAG: UDP-galactopyranose mutase [Thermoguttaceae bacterium]|nr:UDP-galactopyranose mutase [Thermoguttaceae bacterium]
MKFDFVVVGAGLAGSVLSERIASQLQKKVLLIEKRNHVAGNCHDAYDAQGVLVHRYGPHVFHTASEDVWRHLSQFTNWRHYEHRVLASIDGKLVPVPFNLDSLRLLYPATLAARLERKLIKEYGLDSRVPLLTLRESPDDELKAMAEFVYRKVFLGYTIKQWGCRPEDVSPSVTARVPVVVSRDDRYFHDRYQGIPDEGYTKMVERMLDHENISIMLNVDGRDVVHATSRGLSLFGRKFSGTLIYTGPIDAFFNYRFGALPYRSMHFEFEHHPHCERYQATAQVNYPNSQDFTRITEFKQLTGQQASGTTVLREFPRPYNPSESPHQIPCYPVPSPENEALYERYRTEAEKLLQVIFVGRLADYRYYNMDQVVARALMVFDKKLKPSSARPARRAA